MFHPWFKKPAHHLSPPLYRCSCARLLRCTASRCWCDYKAFQKQTRFFLRCLWFMGSGQQACFGTTLRKECKLSEKTSSLRSCKWVCARPSHSLFWCHTIQTTKAKKKVADADVQTRANRSHFDMRKQEHVVIWFSLRLKRGKRKQALLQDA